MSSSASRGQEFEIAEGTDLSQEAAKRWLQTRELAQAENARRHAFREGCLQNSALAALAAGVVGGAAGFRFVRSRSQSMQHAIGGSGLAFTVFATFFVPFSFVGNIVRIRCQRRAASEQARS
mmetsp:Transcript_34050/g.58225  ORF Transcript_34050/g.58225 Transcript_34050/m.58225 type:complete len:122 (+) Transcript_34050:60-425(+)